MIGVNGNMNNQLLNSGIMPVFPYGPPSGAAPNRTPSGISQQPLIPSGFSYPGMPWAGTQQAGNQAGRSNLWNSAGSEAPRQSSQTQAALTPAEADLQKRFPGKYARLAKPEIVKQSFFSLGQTGNTLNEVLHQRPVKDHQLVTLDDTTKRAGSLLIATLATLGLKQRILGTGEYLGLMSWFAAMASTPKIINGMIHLKTGLNLDQQYDSTYGQRQNLYKDPHYLPLHILPDATINQVANRLKIPAGPNRRQQTEEKIRQISVQSHTMWMLLAGPATPVISGLVCDNLQDPVIRYINRAGLLVSGLSAKSSIGNPDSKVVAAKVKAHIDRLVGERPEALLSDWWKDFGQNIIKKTGLNDFLSSKDVLDSSYSALREKITHYFSQSPNFKNQAHLQGILDHLDRSYTCKIANNGTYLRAGSLERLKIQADQFLRKIYDPAFKHAETFMKNAKDQITDPLLKKKANTLIDNLRTKQGDELFTQLETLLKDCRDPDKNASFSRKIDDFLSNFHQDYQIDDFNKQSRYVTARIQSAQSTVTHYRDLFKSLLNSFEERSNNLLPGEKNQFAQKTLQNSTTWLRESNFSVMQDLLQQGHEKEAKAMIGQEFPELFAMIKQNPAKAPMLMGAYPEKHLIDVLKSTKLGNLWRKRMIGYLGGSLLLASGIYSCFFVGRDFNASSSKPAGGAS